MIKEWKYRGKFQKADDNPCHGRMYPREAWLKCLEEAKKETPDEFVETPPIKTAVYATTQELFGYLNGTTVAGTH